jgi:putative component of membrane protein insertase Oxa1/YidC/SpoIIIJ protein YidD
MKAVSLVLQILIRGYQLLVSPLFPPCCRYCGCPRTAASA